METLLVDVEPRGGDALRNSVSGDGPVSARWSGVRARQCLFDHPHGAVADLLDVDHPRNSDGFGR